MHLAAAQAERDARQMLGGCPSTQLDTGAGPQVTPATQPPHQAAPFIAGSFGSFKTIATKDFNTASQSSGPKAPHNAASTHYKTFNKEESEINLKRSFRKAAAKMMGTAFSWRTQLPPEKGSKRTQLLTLSLEKFHERFKLCVDENHHFQGVELRSWSLNPRERRSCRKVTVFQTEPAHGISLLQVSLLHLSLLKPQL